MPKPILLSVLLLTTHVLLGQNTAYFQQRVDYKITAALDDSHHILRGQEVVSYHNNSPQDLPFIYFHIWMNAFQSKKSAYSEQALRQGNTHFYFAEENDLGGYTDLTFSINNEKSTCEIDEKYNDIIKLNLPKPLKSGEKIDISIQFSLKIPYAFSRGGHIGKQYLMTQWYPKPAVFDAQGWHKMPYLDQGEFYAEFGNYDVNLTLPENYIVAATGTLQTASEKEFLDKKAKNTEGGIGLNKTATKTIQYIAENVHDFAWFADKDFQVRKSSIVLKNGQSIETYAFFTPKHAKLWENAPDYINKAVKFYSENIGEYPHPQATAVMTESAFEGGMEYPMITALSGGYNAKSLDGTIAHEVGHNWFQGILANNERDHAWLDEGLNSYYDHRYMDTFYPKNDETNDSWLLRGSGLDLNELLLANKIARHEDQAATVHSDSLTSTNYFLGVYEKPVVFLKNVEKAIGKTVFDSLMHDFYQKWQFKHPQPIDFFNQFRPQLNHFDRDFLPILTQAHYPLSIYAGKKPINLKFAVGTNNPQKRNLFWSPALATNFYDKSMIGVLLYNGFMPTKPFEWAIAPMYATKSKQLTGIADATYSLFTPKNNKITFSANARRFSYVKTKTPNYLTYLKMTPAVTLDFWKKPLSQFVHSLKLRHTFLGQDEAFKDSLERISIKSKWSNMTEFSYSGQIRKTLHPTSFRVAVEKFSYHILEGRQSFVKTTFELNQDFMYREGKKLFTRIFIGGFPVNSNRNSGLGSTRGFLGLSAHGFSDYRFDDFYFGRNELKGLASQQINPNTEGGLKFTAPEGEQLRVGYSNNFIAALNLKANLPFKLPLDIKPYFDMGFFSDTRPNGERATSQFLASGGLAWDFEDYFGVYCPLYFSGDKNDPNSFHSIMTRRGGYLSRITFSFNLKKLDLRRLLQTLY